mgnify:CR=1 FL=1
MSKKIHTIQKADTNELDKEVNIFLEYGWEILDGNYKLIEKVGKFYIRKF